MSGPDCCRVSLPFSVVSLTFYHRKVTKKKKKISTIFLLVIAFTPLRCCFVFVPFLCCIVSREFCFVRRILLYYCLVSIIFVVITVVHNCILVCYHIRRRRRRIPAYAPQPSSSSYRHLRATEKKTKTLQYESRLVSILRNNNYYWYLISLV